MADTVKFTGSVERNLPKYLLDFSLGHTDAGGTMEKLGIASEEDLFLLMAQARLPMPHLDPASTAAMANSLQELLA